MHVIKKAFHHKSATHGHGTHAEQKKFAMHHHRGNSLLVILFQDDIQTQEAALAQRMAKIRSAEKRTDLCDVDRDSVIKTVRQK